MGIKQLKIKRETGETVIIERELSVLGYIWRDNILLRCS